jgi:hypothetical protein
MEEVSLLVRKVGRARCPGARAAPNDDQLGVGDGEKDNAVAVGEASDANLEGAAVDPD